MKTHIRSRSNERGITLVIVLALLVPMILLASFVVDGGRAYLLKANLGKALDAAALAGAQALADGDTAAKTRIENIFAANVPKGFLGIAVGPPDVSFATEPDGSRTITVSHSASVPTGLARATGRNAWTVDTRSQVTRRIVDVAFVIDKSGSLNAVWDKVQEATEQFVKYFDPARDRMALVMYSATTTVMDAMTPTRGFDRDAVIEHIRNGKSGGFTSTAEALYQGWDQLRNVPSATQSGSRIIVLFTDGAPNGVPGQYEVEDTRGNSSTVIGSLASNDFPQVPTGASSTDFPEVAALYRINGTPNDPSDDAVVSPFIRGGSKGSAAERLPYLPATSLHPQHVSASIPTTFQLFEPGIPGQRVLSGLDKNGYPAHVLNANNAARNLTETIAYNARKDRSGAERIRIFTLGLGGLLNEPMGEQLETGASILQRVANDPRSNHYDSGDPEGRYFYAADASELSSAFEAVRNQIIRISE
jgi:Flp pilus assembly protein TadG